jgi:hypothetical protein
MKYVIPNLTTNVKASLPSKTYMIDSLRMARIGRNMWETIVKTVLYYIVYCVSSIVINNSDTSTYMPSGRTMALGSTQPVTEMNTRIISWG